eukprot:167102_1
MKQKWSIINQMDQIQSLEVKSHHINQLLLIFMVIIMLIQLKYTDMAGAKDLDAIGTKCCIETEFGAIDIDGCIEIVYDDMKLMKTRNVNTETRKETNKLDVIGIGYGCMQIECDIKIGNVNKERDLIYEKK